MTGGDALEREAAHAATHQQLTVSAGQRYRTSSPVTARPTSIRWISDVPSKMVKILAVGAVYAGLSAACGTSGINMDSARPVRDESRFWATPYAIQHQAPGTRIMLSEAPACARKP